MEELSEENKPNAFVAFVRERRERFRCWRIDIELGRAALKYGFLPDEAEVHPRIAARIEDQENK